MLLKRTLQPRREIRLSSHLRRRSVVLDELLVRQLATGERVDPRVSTEERVESEGASFAIVVCSEDYEDVFEERDESDGPEDERQDAEDLVVGLGVVNVFGECAFVDV